MEITTTCIPIFDTKKTKFISLILFLAVKIPWLNLEKNPRMQMITPRITIPMENWFKKKPNNRPPTIKTQTSTDKQERKKKSAPIIFSSSRPDLLITKATECKMPIGAYSETIWKTSIKKESSPLPSAPRERAKKTALINPRNKFKILIEKVWITFFE